MDYDFLIVVWADYLSPLPFIVGLVYWRRESRTLKILTLFLGVECLVIGVMYVFASQGINNMFMVHINSLIVYFFVVIIFSEYVTEKMKVLLTNSIPLSLGILLLTLALDIESVFRRPIYLVTLLALVVTLVSMYTLITMLWDSPEHGPFRDERFWLSLGMFFAYAAGTFMYAGISTFLSTRLHTVHSILQIISHLIFAYGFWATARSIPPPLSIVSVTE